MLVVLQHSWSQYGILRVTTTNSCVPFFQQKCRSASSVLPFAMQLSPLCAGLHTFSRKYSTPPPSPESPQPKSGAGRYIGVGAVVIGFGLGYYYFDSFFGKETHTAVKSGIQAAKVKVNFTPSKQDYINVNQTLFLLLGL